MRYLAIDLGEKRTGVAVGDDETGIATPLEVIHASDDTVRMARIAQCVDSYQPHVLVVGLPVNMDQTDGPAAARARAWADQLHKRFGIEVRLADERLTTFEADTSMAGMGLTRKKKRSRRDAVAAAAILRGYFNSAPETDG